MSGIETKLININHNVKISRRAIIDLDVFRLFLTFFPSANQTKEDEIEIFLNNYLTDDVSEILRRNEIIGGLCVNAGYKVHVTSVINKWKRLSRSLLEIKRSPRPLMLYTHMRHVMESYLSSINSMESLFAPNISPVIDEIAAFIHTQKNSSFFISIQECLQSIDQLMSPIDNVILAANMSELGYAEQIGVTNINQRTEKIVGLLSGTKENINSLCNAAPVTFRSQIVHLEGYIIGQVEKQMASGLNVALRALKKIDIEKMLEWCEWLRPIELLHVGLCLSEALQKADYTGCRPEPCNDTIYAVDMLYPHMILSSLQAAPQTLRLSNSDTVMITGANNSGKTSSIKAFAQNCLLAQLGFWIPAQSFRFIPFRQWSTVFSAGEDSQLKASRYQQEAGWLHDAVDSADQHTCLLLNEPFTSTNPVEAAELLRDIIIQLHQKDVTLFLVTHIFDVYDLLKQAGAAFVRSYVTGNVLSAEGLTHTYALEEKKPDGLSRARLLAKEYGLDIGNLISDRNTAHILEEFLAGGGRNA